MMDNYDLEEGKKIKIKLKSIAMHEKISPLHYTFSEEGLSIWSWKSHFGTLRPLRET